MIEVEVTDETVRAWLDSAWDAIELTETSAIIPLSIAEDVAAWLIALSTTLVLGGDPVGEIARALGYTIRQARNDAAAQ